MQSSNFTTREKQLLFKLRSRTLDVKNNFPGQNRNPWCTSCGLFQETQSHLLQCPEIVTKLSYLAGKSSTLNENFVYGSHKQQQIIVKIYSDILEVRENLKQDQNETWIETDFKLFKPFPQIEGPLHLVHCGHLTCGADDNGLVLQHYCQALFL